MDLSSPLFLLLPLLFVATSGEYQVEVYYNGTAELPCNYKLDQYPLDDLVIFWQREAALFELFHGQEKWDNIDSRYINRTRFNRSALSLSLGQVQLEDQGLYKCLVLFHKLPRRNVLHQFPSRLVVMANFSRPEIVSHFNGTLQPGEEVNLSCSAAGGYPKPRGLSWVVKTENVTTKPFSEMRVSKDPSTKLFEVSSWLTVQAWLAPGTNISCVLHPLRPSGSLTSELYHLELPTPPIQPAPPGHLLTWLAVLGILSVMAAGTVALLIMKKGRKWPWPRDRDGAASQNVAGRAQVPEERAEAVELTGGPRAECAEGHKYDGSTSENARGPF
ncbi:T-lymphocyte activation antigen CD86 [Tachyglossus aculeatus]|uniref:T-lymphocyte activation antigen CD86 n=1 Tax=Tachyglossus aculeatus TaxID=9261 RepID=UPI0018F58F1F|nr:T-lymphocyte activation antigen CD86 [Tachyglossus aculeatus]